MRNVSVSVSPSLLPPQTPYPLSPSPLTSGWKQSIRLAGRKAFTGLAWRLRHLIDFGRRRRRRRGRARGILLPPSSPSPSLSPSAFQALSLPFLGAYHKQNTSIYCHLLIAD